LLSVVDAIGVPVIGPGVPIDTVEATPDQLYVPILPGQGLLFPPSLLQSPGSGCHCHPAVDLWMTSLTFRSQGSERCGPRQMVWVGVYEHFQRQGRAEHSDGKQSLLRRGFW
jgi:hypothetical protein